MHQDQMVTAYEAASQALAAAGIRQLAALAFEDEEIGSITFELSRDGTLSFTCCNVDGFPIGGSSL